MKLIGVRLALVAVGSMAAISGISCNHATSKAHTVAAKNVKPGPEESFGVIMDIFRRRMEETPVGFVVSDASSRSTLTGTNKVDSELIKPANESEPYKAVVTVTSQSRYWLNRSKEKDDDSDHEKDSNAKTDKAASDATDEKSKADNAAAEAAQMAKQAAERSAAHASARSADRSMPSKDKDVRTYELVYQGGRWSLVTKLNLETEQSVQNAFKNALDTQE